MQLLVDSLRDLAVAVHIQLQIPLQVHLHLLVIVPILLVQPLHKQML